MLFRRVFEAANDGAGVQQQYGSTGASRGLDAYRRNDGHERGLSGVCITDHGTHPVRRSDNVVAALGNIIGITIRGTIGNTIGSTIGNTDSSTIGSAVSFFGTINECPDL